MKASREELVALLRRARTYLSDHAVGYGPERSFLAEVDDVLWREADSE